MVDKAPHFQLCTPRGGGGKITSGLAKKLTKLLFKINKPDHALV